jgi:hypothetical protein
MTISFSASRHLTTITPVSPHCFTPVLRPHLFKRAQCLEHNFPSTELSPRTELRTLVPTPSRGPVSGIFTRKARPARKARAVRTGPLRTRYFLELANQGLTSRREECSGGTRVRAQFEVHRLAVATGRVGERLSANPLLYGAQVGNFHHDTVERAGASRARVHRASQAEAPATSVPGTGACRSTEGELVHRGGIARCCILAACRIAAARVN